MSREPNDSAGIQASSAKVEAEAENKTQDHGEEMNQDVAESTTIRHPSVVSLTSLDNLDIMFVNSTLCFLNVAGRGVMAVMFYFMPDAKSGKCFRVVEEDFNVGDIVTAKSTKLPF
ncbi:hypothetical protein BDV39DRAFT_208374 [Aspergillus sergii]|uniref:Uncharacterized protein n=1 Tax=Aspergillus sergii TaxID=1034303 RepID=A0A5N6WSH4_9EURO|nr:hypothetical protein BDV39DRAFT_208374 [Aspergillus sergii]